MGFMFTYRRKGIKPVTEAIVGRDPAVLAAI